MTIWTFYETIKAGLNMFFKNLFVKLFKSLAPGRAAGGISSIAKKSAAAIFLQRRFRCVRQVPV